jgi:hypothetical protein
MNWHVKHKLIELSKRLMKEAESLSTPAPPGWKYCPNCGKDWRPMWVTTDLPPRINPRISRYACACGYAWIPENVTGREQTEKTGRRFDQVNELGYRKPPAWEAIEKLKGLAWEVCESELLRGVWTQEQSYRAFNILSRLADLHPVASQALTELEKYRHPLSTSEPLLDRCCVVVGCLYTAFGAFGPSPLCRYHKGQADEHARAVKILRDVAYHGCFKAGCAHNTIGNNEHSDRCKAARAYIADLGEEVRDV